MSDTYEDTKKRRVADHRAATEAWLASLTDRERARAAIGVLKTRIETLDKDNAGLTEMVTLQILERGTRIAELNAELESLRETKVTQMDRIAVLRRGKGSW